MKEKRLVQVVGPDSDSSKSKPTRTSFETLLPRYKSDRYVVAISTILPAAWDHFFSLMGYFLFSYMKRKKDCHCENKRSYCLHWKKNCVPVICSHGHPKLWNCRSLFVCVPNKINTDKKKSWKTGFTFGNFTQFVVSTWIHGNNHGDKGEWG